MPNDGMNVRGPSCDEYETPPWLFKALDSEFGFTLDGAATPENALLPRFRTSVSKEFSWGGERVYCNPPYSNISPFVRMAQTANLAVLLLPSRTDNDWYRLIIEKGWQTRWFRKRIRFYYAGKEVAGSPRFPSFLAIKT